MSFYGRVPLMVPAGSSVAIASSKTVIATGQTQRLASLWFAATNSDGSQTFNGNVELSADNSNWYTTAYPGLKGIAPGALISVRVAVFGFPYVRITGTASGAGLTLSNIYCELQDEFS